MNQTVIELLAQGLGVGAPRSNGLADLAGRWSDEEFCEFEEAVAPFEAIARSWSYRVIPKGRPPGAARPVAYPLPRPTTAPTLPAAP